MDTSGEHHTRKETSLEHPAIEGSKESLVQFPRDIRRSPVGETQLDAPTKVQGDLAWMSALHRDAKICVLDVSEPDGIVTTTGTVGGTPYTWRRRYYTLHLSAVYHHQLSTPVHDVQDEWEGQG